MRTWNALQKERHTYEQLMNSDFGLDERMSWTLTRLRNREAELCSLIRAIEEGKFSSDPEG